MCLAILHCRRQRQNRVQNLAALFCYWIDAIGNRRNVSVGADIGWLLAAGFEPWKCDIAVDTNLRVGIRLIFLQAIWTFD